MIEIRQTAEFRRWLDDLTDRRSVLRINDRILRMRSGNFGDAKAVGEGVVEARLHFGPGYRLYFCRRGAEIVILLCGGDKSTQRADIRRAVILMKELEA